MMVRIGFYIIYYNRVTWKNNYSVRLIPLAVSARIFPSLRSWLLEYFITDEGLSFPVYSYTTDFNQIFNVEILWTTRGGIFQFISTSDLNYLFQCGKQYPYPDVFRIKYVPSMFWGERNKFCERFCEHGMNLRVPCASENFLSSCSTISCSRIILIHGVR
jgi:hypothetical protein